MNNPQVGDIWHFKTTYNNSYILLFKDMSSKQKHMGKPYKLFEGFDLCENRVVHAHFHDMSMWSRAS